LPTASNTHEVAQAAVRGARIVYVDNDPIVLAHARRSTAASRQLCPVSLASWLDRCE
jgi:hypothetical protein